MLSNYLQLTSLSRQEFVATQRNFQVIGRLSNRVQIGGAAMGIAKAIEETVNVT
jgi:hypothetical protein